MAGVLRKRSVTIAGHATSLTLEEPSLARSTVPWASQTPGFLSTALVGSVDVKRDGNAVERLAPLGAGKLSQRRARPGERVMAEPVNLNKFASARRANR